MFQRKPLTDNEKLLLHYYRNSTTRGQDAILSAGSIFAKAFPIGGNMHLVHFPSKKEGEKE